MDKIRKGEVMSYGVKYFEGMITYIDYEEEYGYVKFIEVEPELFLKFCIEVDHLLDFSKLSLGEIISFNVLQWNNRDYAILKKPTIFGKPNRRRYIDEL